MLLVQRFQHSKRPSWRVPFILTTHFVSLQIYKSPWTHINWCKSMICINWYASTYYILWNVNEKGEIGVRWVSIIIIVGEKQQLFMLVVYGCVFSSENKTGSPKHLTIFSTALSLHIKVASLIPMSKYWQGPSTGKVQVQQAQVPIRPTASALQLNIVIVICV